MHPFNFYNIFSSGFIALIVFTLEHTPTHCSPVIENICSHRGEVSYLHILSTKTSPKVYWEAVKLSWKIKFFICCPQSVHTKCYLMLICLLWLTVLVNEWLAKQNYMLCHLYCGSEGRKFLKMFFLCIFYNIKSLSWRHLGFVYRFLKTSQMKVLPQFYQLMGSPRI